MSHDQSSSPVSQFPPADPGQHRKVATVFIRKGSEDLERIISLRLDQIPPAQHDQLLDIGLTFDGNVATKHIGAETPMYLTKALYEFELRLAQTLNAMGLAVSFR